MRQASATTYGSQPRSGRATGGAKLAALERMIPALTSEYDFRFVLPDGRSVSTHCTRPGARRTDIHLRDDVAVSALASMSHRRLYEAYTRQHIDVHGSMEDAVRWARAAVTDPHLRRAEWLARLGKVEEFLRPLRFRIEALKTHYSFPAEFYTSWLGDDDLPVFSQYFFEEEETAADWKAARDRKLLTMAKACELGPDSRLLEIGGGWGGPLRFMARRGIRVTSITLEQNSLESLQRAIREEGVGDRCRAQMADFYTLKADEPYDAIINCGITEHLLDYGAVMEQYCKLVRPGGVIYCDFSAKPNPRHRISSVTRKYIYPASDLVDVPRLLHEQGLRADRLELEQLRNDRVSYAKTSRSWAVALERREPDLVARFGEYPYRMFRYFHWTCAVGFEENDVTAYRATIRRRAQP